MFQEFRTHYPQMALISELVQIDHGKYIVRVAIENEGKTIATGLAAADTIEIAEDRARERAVMLLAPPSAPKSPMLENGIDNPPQPPEVIQKIPVTSKKAAKASKVTEIPLPEPVPEPEPVKAIPLPEPEPVKASKVTEIPLPEPETVKTIPLPEPEPPQVKAIPLLELEPVKAIPVPEPEPEPVAKVLEPEPEPEPEPLFLDTEDDDYSLLSEAAVMPVEEEPEPSPPVVLPVEEIDYSVLKTKIDVEMKRLAWTTEQGREYLISTYGKKSRLLLTNEELLEFYHYLSSI